MSSTFASPLHGARLRVQLRQIQESCVYDAVMRLPISTWGAVLLLASWGRFRHYLESADPALPLLTYSVNLAMHLSTMAFCALIVGTVLLRARPATRARGLEPRLSALLGSFMATTLIFFPRRDLPVSAELTSILLIAAGYSLACVALFQLGRSFSLMPEARRLVTSGIYGFVRHPLYLAEELATIGILIQFFSVWTVVICTVHFAFQLRRIHHEERLLSSAFL